MEGQETEAPLTILYSSRGVRGTIVGEPDTRKEARVSGPVLGHYEVPTLVTQVVRRAAGTRVGCTFKGHLLVEPGQVCDRPLQKQQTLYT